MSKPRATRELESSGQSSSPPIDGAMAGGTGVSVAYAAPDSSSPKAPAEPPTGIERDHLRQVLTFFVSGEEYAVGIFRVREITEYEELTQVPSGPMWMRGVMNLRGSVVPVVDLGAKLGLDETTISRRTCLVIVETIMEGDDVVMALMVDGVNRVVDLAADEMKEPPGFGNRTPFEYLLGMAKIEDRLLPVLDLDLILSATELFRVETVSAPEEEDRRGVLDRPASGGKQPA